MTNPNTLSTNGTQPVLRNGAVVEIVGQVWADDPAEHATVISRPLQVEVVDDGFSESEGLPHDLGRVVLRAPEGEKIIAYKTDLKVTPPSPDL